MVNSTTNANSAIPITTKLSARAMVRGHRPTLRGLTRQPKTRILENTNHRFQKYQVVRQSMSRQLLLSP